RRDTLAVDGDAECADRLERRAADDGATARLAAIPGIGPWSAAEPLADLGVAVADLSGISDRRATTGPRSARKRGPGGVLEWAGGPARDAPRGADAGQERAGDPGGRGHDVRAQVGRVPVPDLPRRRRRGARQPRRQDTHPLLPRGGGAGPRPAARALCDRLRAGGDPPRRYARRARLRAAPAADPPGRLPGTDARGADARRRHRLRPA